MIVTGFDGYARLASGSSYAAVRISALAACLRGAHPNWGAAELKRELFSLAQPDVDVLRFVAQGFMPNPLEHARGVCQADPDHVEVEFIPATEPTSPASSGGYILAPSFVMLQGAGWSREQVYAAIDHALSLFSPCGIVATPTTLHVVSGPRRLRYYHRSTAAALVQATGMPSPNVFFVKDSLARERFDAHSFGSLNSGSASWLVNTVWMMSGARDVGVALAHERYHVLADSGEHSEDETNLMYAETSPTGVLLTQEQCMRLTDRGSARGLLQPRA